MADSTYWASTIRDAADEHFCADSNLLMIGIVELASCFLRLGSPAEGKDRSSKSCPSQPGPENAGEGASQVHQKVQFRRAILEVVAGAFVRLVHQLSQLVCVFCFQCLNRLVDPLVLADDMTSTSAE